MYNDQMENKEQFFKENWEIVKKKTGRRLNK